ncbi:hypothetical protein HK096_011554, partial [Nowakowskiella sp. JEL0078]
AGSRYYDTNGVSASAEQILKVHGTNLVRIRVWTEGDYSIDNAVKIAKRARAVGMDVLIDFHYSNTCEFIYFFIKL